MCTSNTGYYILYDRKCCDMFRNFRKITSGHVTLTDRYYSQMESGRIRAGLRGVIKRARRRIGQITWDCVLVSTIMSKDGHFAVKMMNIQVLRSIRNCVQLLKNEPFGEEHRVQTAREYEYLKGRKAVFCERVWMVKTSMNSIISKTWTAVVDCRLPKRETHRTEWLAARHLKQNNKTSQIILHESTKTLWTIEYIQQSITALKNKELLSYCT